jgi:hypothetical protein
MTAPPATGAGPANRIGDPRSIAAYVIAIAVIGVSIAVLRSLPVHHDIAWPLYVAEQVTSGARPYVDIIEVHPPLILWFAMAALQLARLLGISPAAGYHALAFTVALTSLFAASHAVRLALPDNGARRAALMLVLTVLMFPFVGYSFGQEEHLMLCLTLPYLLAVAGRMDGRALSSRAAVAIGIMAGIGLAMKPLYGLGWLAAEAALAGTVGWRKAVRTESVSCAAMLVLYPLLVLLATPDYLRVASWAAQVYFAFHPTPLLNIVLSGSVAFAAVAIIVHAAVGRREVAAARRVLLVFLLACVAIVFAQGKGWTYHWYPAICAALLLGYLAVTDLVGRFHADGPTRRTAFLLIAAVPLLIGVRELRADAERYATLAGGPYHLPTMLDVVQRYAPHGPIMVFSTTMQIGFPLVSYSGAAWTSRFATLWLLPGLYAGTTSTGRPFPYHPLDSVASLERYLLDSVYEDMRRAPPALLVVDRYPPSDRMVGFNYLEYFGRDPRLRALYDGFHLVAEVDRYLIYARDPG